MQVIALKYGDSFASPGGNMQMKKQQANNEATEPEEIR